MEQQKKVITIPEILKNENFRFCRLKKGTKKPFEKDWTNKPYTFNEISKYLETENYGILCGHANLAVIDSDNPHFQVAVENMFPDTFRVKTGSGGMHNYFYVPDLKEKIILYLDEKIPIHLGEVQSHGTQVVGAGSIHPNGNIYEVINNVPISTISVEYLKEKLKPFIKTRPSFSDIKVNPYGYDNETQINDLPLTSIIDMSGMKKRGHEYQGANIWHGSETGQNLTIDPLKNVGYCFRCSAGINPAQAIALNEGIIQTCSDKMSKEQFLQVVKIAQERYGLKKLNKNVPELFDKIQSNFSVDSVKQEKVKVIWSNELKDYNIEEKGWIVEKLIPTKSNIIITGKRGTMKTYLTLLFSYCIATGNDFLGVYQTEKNKILYLDKENGIEIMKTRCSQIEKGLGIDNVSNIGFICFSQLKVDRLGDIIQIEELIKEHQPKLLIIDTYRRSVSYDENDAGEVSRLFVDSLRPLIEKYNLSIIMIHHDKKSNHKNNDNEEYDEIDQMRGSSDLGNYADVILSLRREKDNLILKQLKNRNAQEEKPIKIEVKFDNESNLCHFEYKGEYIKRAVSDKCAEALILWISSNKINEFKTNDAKNLIFEKGFKKSNFYNALEELVSRGIIEKICHGSYIVKKN